MAGLRRVRAAAVGTVWGALLLLGGCGDTTGPTTTGDALINGGGPVLDGAVIDGSITVPADAPGYEAHTCGIVLDWTYELVAVVNHFTTVSREDSPAERRADYLVSFDDALALVAELRARLEDGPAPPTDGMDAALEEAVERSGQELADARRDAEELPDEAYEVRRVRSGRLFVASEKARSLVFGGLDTVATEQGLTGLFAPCGRPQYPDVVELD